MSKTDKQPDKMKLHRRTWSAVKLAAGVYPMQRTFDMLPDDWMLVSYPRSGSTWLRFLISNVRFADEGPTTFENLNDRIPYALRPAAKTMARLPRPRILKSHSAYDWRFRKVVLLVRDPRDVAISYYHYHIRRKKIEAACPIEEYVPRFVRGEMDNYGTWGENVGSWLGARIGTTDFVLVRYEDLKQNTVAELAALCEFMGLATDNATLQTAVDASGPKTMNPRKASPGEWRETLCEQSVAEIERCCGRVMTDLGYPVSQPQPGQGAHHFRAMAG